MKPTHAHDRNRFGGAATSLLLLLNVITLAIAILGIWGLNQRFEAKLADQKDDFERRIAAIEAPPSGLTLADIEPLVDSLLAQFWPEQLESLNDRFGLLDDEFGEIRELLSPLESLAEQLGEFDRFREQLDALKLAQIAQETWFKTQFDELGDLQGQLFDLQDVIKSLPLNVDTGATGTDLSDIEQLRELLEQLQVALPAAMEARNEATARPTVDLNLPDEDAGDSTPAPAEDEQVELLIRVLQEVLSTMPAEEDAPLVPELAQPEE